MAKKSFLTPSQKEEIRRLTQLANRRIKAAERAYTKAGKTIMPKEMVGHLQIKQLWHTANTPLSRSVNFETQAEYRKHLKFLRSFETQKMGIKEYSEIQRSKTLEAIHSSLGDRTKLPTKLLKKINKMSAPELADFWNLYEDNASKMGMSYSSNDNMSSTLAQFFDEDIQGMFTRLDRR